jgi:uncharacterized protein (TIGR00255 family)
MIHGMTAFARGEARGPAGRLACEIRSVNHRYLDLSLRLPEALRAVEPALRERVRGALERGKVEVSMHLEADAGTRLAVDDEVLAALGEAVAVAADALGERAGPVDPIEALRWPGVLRERGGDDDARTAAALELLETVLADFLAHRGREGARLAELVEARLAAIEAIVAEVAAEADGLVENLRERLRTRAAALAADLDPQRLEQEVALLAQKADVAEELDRLATHVAEVRRTLEEGGPVGRRLDFLAQELNREANTLASKATQAGVALRAVDLKVLIEQIREQIQNLE